jgi:transglutaminase-like putative cysteine protease
MTVRGQEIPRRPAEGWLSLLLVYVMVYCLAWSLADSRWVLGRFELTSFLPVVAAGGVAWGFISAKVGWSRWLAHLLGAILAGLILPIMVGGVMLNGNFLPGPAFNTAAASVISAYLDLAFLGKAFTQQYGHFILILAILVWGTGQFASYAVFGHRRPLNAVVMTGVVLVLNMSLTLDEQLGILIWFSLAAMFLLIQLHALDEQASWLRHRLGSGGSLAGFYLRGGTAFIVVAVLGALVLTSTASSAPLGSLWRGMDQHLVELTQGLEAVFRGGGPGTRISPVDFLASTRITGNWTTDETPVLKIKVPAGDPLKGDYHWGAVAYDTFDGEGWSIPKSQKVDVDVGAGDNLLAKSLDDPAGLLDQRTVSVTVTELGFDPNAVFSAGVPVKVSVPTTASYVGTVPDRYLGTVVKNGATEYQVTGSVPDVAATQVPGSAQSGLTENKLRVAGTQYPDIVKANDLQVDPSVANGPNTRDLLAAIKAAYPDTANDPYDLANDIVNYLKDDKHFHYQTDMSNVNCGTDGVVECFARVQRGFCEYYASTMAVLLRMEGVPARFVTGFLPSAPDANGVETIRKSAAHAWVEVYFPHYGWVMFDPTGGGIGQSQVIAAGPQVTALPTIAPSPLGSFLADPNDPRRTPNRGDNSGTGTTAATTGGGPGTGGFVAIGLILAAIMGTLVVYAWQRGPRTAEEPDKVYGGVVGLARRFGFGPRPSETVYEYASSLGDVLPGSRPDLSVVARAKVEVAYGRRTLGPSRIDALRQAQRHLRVALLGLVFHRKARKAHGRNRPPGSTTTPLG